MGVIVDTSIWVEIERDRVTLADIEALAPDDDVCVTPTVVAELQYGVERAASDAQRRRRAADLGDIKTLTCLPIDAATGEVFGRIAAQQDSRGRPSTHRVQDLWTASVALQHRMKVLTVNRGDFEDIPGLTVLSPPPARPQP